MTKSEAVRVWLLGGFKVSVGSRTIGGDAWRLKKALALVKLLALAPGHRLHREQAMDLLWPDLGKKAASNNLRQVLYAARRVLDPGPDSRKSYLTLQGEQLVLCSEGQLWVDVDAFEKATTTARRSGDPATYKVAIDLYAGDLLPEDRYEGWAEGWREELRQSYLSLLVELAGLYEERHEHGLAIEALRMATVKEPTLEEAHVGLMRLHFRSGKPEQARAQYERLRDALSRGLGTEPAVTTRLLRDEIAAGRLPPPPSAGAPQEEVPPDGGKHNLPAPRTSFVGREQETVEVKRTLAMTRLLTLTGAGGSGKTRLALEVARELVGVCPDGVWLVELAPLAEPELVTQAVAEAIGVSERPGEPLTDTLVETLVEKELLLILDNCEHLVDAAARLVDTLLDSCPRLRVLATSREPLSLGGEVLWRVPPLSLPDNGGERTNWDATTDGVMRYEAVRLFVDRARLRLPDFGLSQDNAGAVVRVCRRLEGIPLAIELATARMGTLAVEQVAQRLEVSLDVLKGASRTATPRHQTLRATLDWSHDLLSEAEQALFRRLSVFVGGWTLEAAETVCYGGGVEQADVLDLLGGLVDKSILVAREGTGGAVRYRMLEPIRQYVREKLNESGEVEEVQDRHAAFFLALTEAAEPQLTGPEQGLWVERLEADQDNLREALSWILKQGEADLGLRFGSALWRYWFAKGYLSEGIRWLEGSLAGGETAASSARVNALEGLGWLAQVQGDAELAEATYQELLKVSQELGDNGNIATALNSLGTVAAYRGDHERARALLEENLAVLQELEDVGNTATTLKRYHALNLLGFLASIQENDHDRAAALWQESLKLAREAGDTYRVGVSLISLGYAALLQGDHEAATTRCVEALAFARDLGSAGVELIPETLINLGLAARDGGDHERAATSFEEALAVSQEAGKKPSVTNALEGMAGLAGAREEDVRAARLWGAAEAMRQSMDVALPPGERALHEPYLAAARSRLGDAAWEVALAEGRAMSLEEAAGHALSGERPDAPTAPITQAISADQPPIDLTPREREVTLLAARGLTNRQISTKLSISERTVGNHVAKILKKLGLTSRVQVANWAAEHWPFGPNSD